MGPEGDIHTFATGGRDTLDEACGDVTGVEGGGVTIPTGACIV